MYDKKLLWRANLYIGERGEDWNDRHPWNSEENEWNKGYEFQAGKFSVGKLPEPSEDSEGRQTIKLYEFTWHGDGHDYNIGSVVYSIGCHDSPFEYNIKMDHQKAILDYDFLNDIDPYDKKGNEYDLEGWRSTCSPSDRYLDPEDETLLGKLSWYNYAGGEEGVQIGGLMYYPYRPGYSSAGHDDVAGYVKSAGVDCVGLVQRALSYGGEPYHLKELEGYDWNTEDPWKNRNFPTVEDKDLWEVTRSTNQDENGNPVGLERVIPGDIVYYRNDAGTGHVMMVAEVEYSGEGRNPGLEGIKIIEATYGKHGTPKYATSVIKERSVDSYSDDSWVIGRLR